MNSKKLISMILLLLLLTAIPIQVFAMEAVTAEIPFTVKNASGTVIVEAVGDAPLPNQTVFEGVSAGKFEVSFTEPGDYCYKVYEIPGTEQDVTYDRTVYTVCVSVFLDESGELYSVTAVNIEDSSQKADNIEFENTLPEPTVPSEPSEPGEPTEPTAPDSPDAPPYTGDDSHLTLWTVLMLVSFLGLTECFLIRKKVK